eukprot:IDg4815t1
MARTTVAKNGAAVPMCCVPVMPSTRMCQSATKIQYVRAYVSAWLRFRSGVAVVVCELARESRLGNSVRCTAAILMLSGFLVTTTSASLVFCSMELLRWQEIMQQLR